MNASYTLLYIYDAERTKRKKAVLLKAEFCTHTVRNDTDACHLSSPRDTPGLKHSTLRSSPKAIGRAALNLRYT